MVSTLKCFRKYILNYSLHCYEVLGLYWLYFCDRFSKTKKKNGYYHFTNLPPANFIFITLFPQQTRCEALSMLFFINCTCNGTKHANAQIYSRLNPTHFFLYKHTDKLGWSSICLWFSQFEPEIMLDGMLTFKTHFMVWYCIWHEHCNGLF